MCKNPMQSVKSTQPLSEDHIAMHPHEELVITGCCCNIRRTPFLKSFKRFIKKRDQYMRVQHCIITWIGTILRAEEGHAVYPVNVYMHDIVAVNCAWYKNYTNTELVEAWSYFCRFLVFYFVLVISLPGIRFTSLAICE